MIEANPSRPRGSLPAPVAEESPAFSPRAFVLFPELVDVRAASLAGRLERYRSTRITRQLDELERLLRRPDELTGLVLLANGSGAAALHGAELAAALCPTLPRVTFTLRDELAAGSDRPLPPREHNIARFVRHALIAESCAHPAVARSVVEYAEAKGLTPREAEILATNVVGIERGQVVEELGISGHTFKRQVKSILRKCGAEALDRVAVLALLTTLTTRQADLAI